MNHLESISRSARSRASDLGPSHASAVGGTNRQTRLIGGVSYQLAANTRLLADLDRVSFQSGATARTQGLLQAQFNF